MQWDTPFARSYEWPSEISNRPAKEEVARELASKVRDGEVIGFGSGSTAYLALEAIADRIKRENLEILAIPTSSEITLACNAHGIPTATLLDYRPDWCFDGADEVDPEGNMIKGRGAAFYREKLLINAAPKTYILADRSKLVDKLCCQFAIPIEVDPLALNTVSEQLLKLGATELRLRPALGAKDGPTVTENGNFLIEARFAEVHQHLERDIKCITGVLESGLFWGRKIELLVSR